VVPRPKDKSIFTSKWLYKIKHGFDGSAEKFKARFIARRFSRKEGVDYDEIFSPISNAPPSAQSYTFLPNKDGTYIRWMSRPLYFMVQSERKSMWNNPRGLRFMIGNLMYAS